MTKVILFGSHRVLDAWLAEHDHEFVGWKGKQTGFEHPDGSRVLLVPCVSPQSAERIRGITIDDLEVHGPSHEHLWRAEEMARTSLFHRSVPK